MIPHRTITLLLLIMFAFTFSNCTNERRDARQPEPDQPAILIAYFSWADNTVIENPDLADIDAMTSASLIAPGNTGQLARMIQDAIGGDLFPILVAEPYSSDFTECVNRVREELTATSYPALKTNINNIDDYDIVFLGYPVWANTCPMAIFSFIEKNDLSGKTILIFSAFGSGSMEKSVNDIAAALPDSSILIKNTFGAPRSNFASAQENIKVWLAELDIDFKSQRRNCCL